MIKSLFSLGGLLLAATVSAPLPALAEDRVFPLEEVSVFKELENHPELARAVSFANYADCDATPRSEVKKYPELKSQHPLYGTIDLGGEPLSGSGSISVHFVLDQTQPTVAPPKPKPSVFRRILGSWWFDDSDDGEEMLQFDRLYFDANRDLDLTNDPVLSRLKDPPWGNDRKGEFFRLPDAQPFEFAKMEFDGGPGGGTHTVQLLLTVVAATADEGYLEYRSPTARKGVIQIGDRQFTAVLAQTESITGRFDKPFVGLFLFTPQGIEQEPFWWGGNFLGTMREYDGQLYSCHATPSGDQLTVRPYTGDYGTLEIAAKGGGGKDVGAVGALLSRDGHLLFVGKAQSWYASTKEQSKRLPVGDYWPMNLTVGLGGFEVDFSPSRYDENGQDAAQEPRYLIKIRKDQSFAIDFSERPEITVVNPRPGATVKANEEIYVEAILVDRKLGLMIRDIEDTSGPGQEVTFQVEDGKPVTFTRYPSLNPTVTITDAAGAVVASGAMPFG
ncbi:MAG: hypothetical protein FJ276_04810 [Planctomycetes bacterium]|nr:hypothetical protein [Planctomycetota bacterium]